jgi:hypothetical protein
MMNNIEETTLYYTVNDAIDVVNAIGLNSFLENLFKESKQRSLTIEEIEAMQTLHDSWEL